MKTYSDVAEEFERGSDSHALSGNYPSRVSISSLA
jgi:hypothetical protein